MDKLEALRERARAEAISRDAQSLSENERRDWRLHNLPVIIHHLGNGQYSFVGLTKDDIENNKELVAKFDRAVVTDRQNRKDNAILGSFA